MRYDSKYVEEFAMGLAIFPPSADICNKHTSADNVCKRGACLLQGVFNISNTLPGLFVAIIRANNISLMVDRRRTCNVNPGTDAHRPAIADDVLRFGGDPVT